MERPSDKYELETKSIRSIKHRDSTRLLRRQEAILRAFQLAHKQPVAMKALVQDLVQVQKPCFAGFRCELIDGVIVCLST